MSWVPTPASRMESRQQAPTVLGAGLSTVPLALGAFLLAWLLMPGANAEVILPMSWVPTPASRMESRQQAPMVFGAGLSTVPLALGVFLLAWLLMPGTNAEVILPMSWVPTPASRMESRQQAAPVLGAGLSTVPLALGAFLLAWLLTPGRTRK